MAIAVPNRCIPLSAIREASHVVYADAVRTPLVRVEVPRGSGAEVEHLYLKLENLQPIGSFKIRGASNALTWLSAEDRRDGIWTVSAGNAAQGVAWVARRAGTRCSVMLVDATPDIKRRALERLGATIIDATYEECWRTAVERRSPRMTGHFVHPFDDDHVIAGNGTAALEILEDLPDVDAIVAPVGGGGLVAGIAAAIRELRPNARVFGAEPETAAPLHVSLTAGRPSRFDRWTASFVDGAGGQSVVESMWPLLQSLAGAIVVSLDEVARAIRIVAERAHVIAEGAAGCAVAAALSGRAGGGKVVAIVSGGNIDWRTFASILGV